MKTAAITPSSQSLPDGLSRSDWLEVVEGAARRWSYPAVPCSSTRVVVRELLDWRTVAEDDVNLVVFRKQVWCKNERCGRDGQFASQTMAMTQTYPAGARGADIRGGDIELNSVGFSFEVNGELGVPASSLQSTNKPRANLEAVVVHELGHVLGLEDKCVSASGEYLGSTCSRDDTSSVMFAPGQHLELAPSDVAELCALYPRETPARTELLPGRDSARWDVTLLFGAIAVVAVCGVVMVSRYRRSV